MKQGFNAHDNILALIGKTPLIRLNKITKDFYGTHFCKYEAFNPGHSNRTELLYT